MKGLKSYENFPFWIPLLAVLVSVISCIIGAVILSGFSFLVSIVYVLYCISIELMVIFRSCKDCWYYGNICGSGKSKIAPLFVKKGDTKKFVERDISMLHMIPDFMVSILPLVGGIVLLILNFTIVVIVLIFIFAILSFGGTAFIRGTLICKRCKQKDIGCPAHKIFNKNSN